MRLFLFSALFSIATAAGAEPLRLFNFQVYAKDNLTSQNSDYLGLTGAGRSISLRNFLIMGWGESSMPDLEYASRRNIPTARRSTAPINLVELSLVAGNDLRMTDGKVLSGYSGGVAEGRSVTLVRAQAGTIRSIGNTSARPSVSHASLSREMDELSQYLLSSSLYNYEGVADVAASEENLANANSVLVIRGQGAGSTNLVQLEASAWEGRDVRIVGSDAEIFVITVRGRQASILNKGFFIEGSVTPDQILFHFPEAQSLTLARSGVDRKDRYRKTWGIPGSVLAPRAVAYFNDVLLTGQLFVREIDSVNGSLASAGKGSDLLPGGQVNPGCFSGGPLIRVGCGGQFVPPPPSSGK